MELVRFRLSTRLQTKSAYTVAEQIQHYGELIVTRPHMQLVYEQSQNLVYKHKFAILSTSV